MLENFLVIDTFIVRDIQSSNLHHQVNPIYLDIGKSSNFYDFFIKYPNTRSAYRFQLISITPSTNIINTNGEILIMCKGLKDAKSATLRKRKMLFYV